MDELSKKILAGAGAVLIIGFIFYGGYKLGFTKGHDAAIQQDVLSASSTSLKGNFSLFWDAVSIVRDDFYKPQKIQNTELLYGAISGMVKSLDDPYSSFFNPEDAEKFSEDVTGSFGGIGAQIGIRDGQLVVISPLKDNPAENVGLESGDEILKIDDTLTQNISIDEAVKLLRGEEGTDVTVTIMREGWEDTKDFTITRDIIKVPTLDWEMKEGKIAHIQLYSFNANAPSRFYEASLRALLDGARGVVLDLRNNSGGFLEVGTNIAGWFVERGDVIVQEKFPSGKVRKMRSQGSGVWSKVPVAVLVNEGSASAAEIVAGAIRDQIGAPLVGETTFGKGTVQKLETLADGSKLKISVAEWVTPAGSLIHEKGLEPDYKVEFNENGDNGDSDPQLEKALELVRSEATGRRPLTESLLPETLLQD